MTARILAALILASARTAAQTRQFLHAPAVDQYAKHDPSGVTILPNGRLLQPAGRHIPVAQNPHGLAISQDGRTLFVASEGKGQLITEWTSDSPQVQELLPPPSGSRRNRNNAGGAAFSPDGRVLYWSSGETGKVFVFDVQSRALTGEIDLNVPSSGRKYVDSFAMDLALSPDGRYLYAADVTNFRVAILDTAKRAIAGSVQVGRYPFALAVRGNRVYVANIGMFEYSPIVAPITNNQQTQQPSTTTTRTRTNGPYDPRGLTFPAFGYPSREAHEGVEFEGRHVPGLGDPNAPESFSVWGIDVSDPANPLVVSRLKTGLLVGAPAENGKTIGGSAPNFITIHNGALYVSNGNNDMIEKVDLARNRVVWRSRIVTSPLVAKLRGVGPSGMTVSPDGNRLYVAESGINAIGVIDTNTGSVVGHIPTAWYPYRVVLSKTGNTLAVICFKGFGNGPRGGKDVPKSEFLGMKGVLSVVSLPKTQAELARGTYTVLASNGIVDRSANRTRMSSPLISQTPGTASNQIKYVVFITKENHTYDTIFDRIPGANDDPSLLRWGNHQGISNPGQPTLDDVAVMTNHNALARQFTVSDNFYMEPEASGVGHRWLVGVQPNNFCQMTYTLGWNFKANSTAPGRRVSFGSNGSIAPEDYPEAGSMWEHLARSGVRFRNYGEGFEFAGVKEDEDEEPTGAREVINMPMPKALYDNTCREFPIFNMNIPDQFRADQFVKDFSRLYMPDGSRQTAVGGRQAAGGSRHVSRIRNPKSAIRNPQSPPSFINIAICNDHGTSPKPEKGYPYLASWMADNDLALGRIIEFLSHTPYWKNMAIFVTQDDSGGEPDHVDAQRSVLLVIGPWVKRGYVSHHHTTILSMHRTLYQILGLPPLNMFDALANDFSDCFTTTPDFRPYTHTPVDPRIFDPKKTRDPKDPEYRKARNQTSVRMDDPAEVERVERLGGRH